MAVVLGGAFLLAVAVLGGVASAAHNARMDVAPTQVEPGGQVTVEGLWNFADTPVRLHWDALDGPVLATLDSEGSFGPATVQIPDAEPGTYVLIANQDVPRDHRGAKAIPARAQIRVVAPGATGPGPGEEPAAVGSSSVPRLAALQTSSTPNTAALVAVALGTAVITLAVGLLLGRRVSPGGPASPGGF